MADAKQIFVSPTLSILETIAVIDREGIQIALVVDEKNCLKGTVTDGDIRRGILNEIELKAPVSSIMNAKPTIAYSSASKAEILGIMKAKGLRHLPILDAGDRVLKLEFLDELIASAKRPNPVLLMAGGEGARLRPLTQDCPKPLLNVGGRPILETIILQLSSYGFHDFFISIHYKGEMIREYFGNGSKWGVSIRYLEEQEKLGTAGALNLLPEPPKSPLIVMNGDLLTKINFEQLLEFHIEQKAVATMGIREYDFRVPYGVVRLDGEQLTSIDEKPLQKFFVNAGIYVLDPSIFKDLARGRKIDMPELFRVAIERKEIVSAFPIREYWLDIGKPDDFERANFDFVGVFRGSSLGEFDPNEK